MAAEDPYRRIAQLRQRLQELVSASCRPPDLLVQALQEACCDLQEIEESLDQDRTGDHQAKDSAAGNAGRGTGAEVDKRESEEMHKLLFENANDGIMLHGLTSEGLPDRFIQANDRACQMLGYSKEELRQLTPLDIQLESTPEEIQQEKRQISKDKRLLLHKKLIARDGKTVSAEIHTALFELQKRPVVVAVIRDIAERQDMEIALRKSRDFLDKIINSIGDPIFVKDHRHRYILVNDAECSMIGRKREDILGKTCCDFFPEEQARVFWERDELVLETGCENINEEQATDSSGNTRTVITKKALYKDEDDNRFLVGIVRDITDRKRIEDQLRQTRDLLEEKVLERTRDLEEANCALRSSEDFLDKIINSLGDPVYVKDRQHRLILVNDAACKLFNRSRSDLIGRTAYDLFPVDHMADISWEKDEEVFLSGNENVNVETNTYSPGVTLTVLAKKTLYRDNAGNEFLVGITRDITDLKSTEEKLRAAKEAAEEAARSKSEFLANMSHEIRTPLNAVVGLTGLLLSADLTAEQRDYVETVRDSGRSLLSVISDILDFSKIEGGKMELECQPFDLRDCIEVAFDLVSSEASEKALALRFSLPEDLPKTIIGDVTRLRQVLVNLLSNAVKFTDRGSVELEVAAHPGGGGMWEIHFAVKDTGIGIPEDKADRLFLSFSQIESSTTRKYGGTGLGLAISKRLVEMMGGRIWVTGNPGPGCTFHFTVLAKASVREIQTPPARLERSAEKAPEKRPDGSRDLRILLAEDNCVNQKVALQMLKRIGYSADVAANGLEVLQALERQSYDVILMDIQMPEMNGFEAARKIREMWPNGPKIIAITAYALDGDRERCIQAGMDDYIAKPIQIEELQSVLESCY